MSFKRIVPAGRDIDDFARKIVEDIAAEGGGTYKKGPGARGEKGGKGEEPEAKNAHKGKKDPEERKGEKKGDHASTGPARPKRPLTAGNLTVSTRSTTSYRFKREKILEAHRHGLHSKAAIEALIATVAGLEGHPCDTPNLSSKRARGLRRTAIRSSMADKITSKDGTKRAHRKSHGAMSFLEMGRIMSVSWKTMDDFSREVFEELAEEGRKIYQEKVKAYVKKVKKSEKEARKRRRGEEKTLKTRGRPSKKAAFKASWRKKLKVAVKKESTRKARPPPKPRNKASSWATLTPNFKDAVSPDDTFITPLAMDEEFFTYMPNDPTVVTTLGAVRPPALHLSLLYPQDHEVYCARRTKYSSEYGVSATASQPTPLFPDIFQEEDEVPMEEEDTRMLARDASEVGSEATPADLSKEETPNFLEVSSIATITP
ncbi:hypothetical protein ACHAXT_004802, partial [Thalassiosira profunda]